MWGAQGELLAARALYYGLRLPTNNAAELGALLDASRFVVALESSAGQPAMFVGDSKLVVDFCSR